MQSVEVKAPERRVRCPACQAIIVYDGGPIQVKGHTLPDGAGREPLGPRTQPAKVQEQARRVAARASAAREELQKALRALKAIDL